MSVTQAPPLAYNIEVKMMRALAAVGTVGLTVATLVCGTAARASDSAGCRGAAPRVLGGAISSGPLVPHGAVSLLLCRYDGLNPPKTAGRLAGSKIVSSAGRLGTLTSEFDALPRSMGVFHCPMDDGSEIVATFVYLKQPSIELDIRLTGCRTVTRGNMIRSASGPAGTRLLDQLMALVA